MFLQKERLWKAYERRHDPDAPDGTLHDASAALSELSADCGLTGMEFRNA